MKDRSLEDGTGLAELCPCFEFPNIRGISCFTISLGLLCKNILPPECFEDGGIFPRPTIFITFINVTLMPWQAMKHAMLVYSTNPVFIQRIEHFNSTYRGVTSLEVRGDDSSVS